MEIIGPLMGSIVDTFVLLCSHNIGFNFIAYLMYHSPSLRTFIQYFNLFKIINHKVDVTKSSYNCRDV